MCASVAVASAVHALAVLIIPWDRDDATAHEILGPAPKPVIMHLQPQDSARPSKRLVDITTPTQDPVDLLTDLIAEANASAADAFDIDSGENAPRMEEVDDFDSLTAPKPPVQVEPSPAPPTQPTPESPEQDDATERMQIAEVISEPDLFEREVSAFQPPVMAEEQVDNQPETPVLELPQGRTRGRKRGGVEKIGLLNFEALQDEIAPYLKVVRNRVERRWRQAILLRFSGATRRKAVLDCAIAPDGRIVEVTIFESGGSGTYAEMCRQAVLAAGPFPPFPFEVPPGYRTKNIEIRWTFSYL